MNSRFDANSGDNLLKPTAPVRKIKPTRRSVSGFYPFRGEASVPFESTLERDFLIRCEFQVSVLEVISQPVEIPFKGENGNSYTYTPDFLVYYKLGHRDPYRYPKPLLAEVKPLDEWRSNWRAWSAKWKSAIRFAREQGWDFRIYDESRIRDEMFSNIRFLERYGRMAFDKADSNQILNSVAQMGGCTVDYLLSRHFQGHYRSRGLANIWHLVAKRKLDSDMTSGLSESSEIWVLMDE